MTQRQFPSLGAPCDILEVQGREEESRKTEWRIRKRKSYLKQKEKHDLLKDHKNKKNNTKDVHIAFQEQMHETCKPATYGKLHSTAKVTMWLLPCLMFATTPSESHYADRTGFLRFFRWGNGTFAQGHKEWVQSPASYSGSRAGFIYSSPHTQGRVEYRRQDRVIFKHAYVM